MNVRNIIVLSICQALSFSGIAMVVLVGGIIGITLAPSRSLATLPVATMFVGTALSTVPAALLMRRIGRRRGFALSAGAASLACLGAACAIAGLSFPLFCLATAFIGANYAFAQQYRFAAAESSDASHVGKAVSLVLVGGVVAGFLGPQIGATAKDWLPAASYAGSFAVLAGLYACAALLMSALRDTAATQEAVEGPERSLAVIISQPRYLVAVWSGVVAYALMGLVMTAAPISMHVMSHFGLSATTLAVQSHVIAMYAPAPFAGFIVDRIGALRLQVLGVAAMLGCVAFAVFAHGFAAYWGALVLLGVGWNFLFTGGTVLLTQTYYPLERFRAQAANELTVFGIYAVATLSAGSIIVRTSWQTLNLLLVPFLAVTLLLIFVVRATPAIDTTHQAQ